MPGPREDRVSLDEENGELCSLPGHHAWRGSETPLKMVHSPLFPVWSEGQYQHPMISFPTPGPGSDTLPRYSFGLAELGVLLWAEEVHCSSLSASIGELLNYRLDSPFHSQVSPKERNVSSSLMSVYFLCFLRQSFSA